MKLAVVGSREFNDWDLLNSKLNEIHAISPISVIVSGGAKGADSFAEKWAKEKNIETKIFIPDWNKFGKSAGFRRNKDICNEADEIIAFWDGISKGTQHSIQLSKDLNKKLILIKY